MESLWPLMVAPLSVVFSVFLFPQFWERTYHCGSINSWIDLGGEEKPSQILVIAFFFPLRLNYFWANKGILLISLFLPIALIKIALFRFLAQQLKLKTNVCMVALLKNLPCEMDGSVN